MVSTERDKETCKRQHFNTCCKNVTLLDVEFTEYLSALFPTDRPTITWADFTDCSEVELKQVSGIARRATPLSVLRVTLMAESPIYRKLHLRQNQKRIPQNRESKLAKCIDDFREMATIGNVAHDAGIFVSDMFMQPKYPTLLAHVVLGIIASSCSPPKTFVPLHAVKYSDGTVMMSVTGIFCTDAAEETKLREHFEVRGGFSFHAGEEPAPIDIPVLTTKERLHLEPVMPPAVLTGETSMKRLGYLIDGDGSRKTSKRKMQQYEKYRLQYPFFGKLIP